MLPQFIGAQSTEAAAPIHIFIGDGVVLMYFGQAFSAKKTSADGLRGNLRVPRKVLRQMLLDRLAPGTDGPVGHHNCRARGHSIGWQWE